MSEPIIYSFCHAYWRQIKAGNRTYEGVPEKYKPGTKALARTDVVNGVVTSSEYEQLIGEPYIEEPIEN